MVLDPCVESLSEILLAGSILPDNIFLDYLGLFILFYFYWPATTNTCNIVSPLIFFYKFW